jgi:hypothetical protein
MEPSPIVTQLVRRDGCRIYWPGVLITAVASTVVGLVGLKLLANKMYTAYVLSFCLDLYL